MTRAYVMRARAAAAEGTRQSILESAVDELWGRRLSEVLLETIAARAGVTVQTVLRVFGSRARLIDAAWEATRDRIRTRREQGQPGDIDATIRALFDHYEELGDFVVRLLADEDRLPDMAKWLQQGRTVHRRSVQRQFSPWIEARAAAERTCLVDCLVAACDVYTWKLLRRDMHRNRTDAETCVRRMVTGILGEGKSHGSFPVRDVGRRRQRAARDGHRAGVDRART